MKSLNILFLLFLSFQATFCQNFPEAVYQDYDSYKEQTIQERRFKYHDIEPLIQQLDSVPLFEVKEVGRSIEGRPINLIRIGSGETNLLFWSQMHGDEPTATMALFDLFNFFKQANDRFSAEKQQLLDKVSLYFIPMLNPDGAERFDRRNAIGIDINRDALRTVSPESRILKTVRDSLDPAFGFNLHDQSTYYTTGRSGDPATISFLAPAYDYEKSENEVRTNAMRLIGYLNQLLQQHIPGRVAKYSDEHEPRAFGDMIQKWGTSTILIESGGYPGDPEKQFIRKLNFVTLLAAIEAIAQESFSDVPVENYYQIPENKYFLTDLLIRKAVLVRDGNSYLIDISIKQQERSAEGSESSYYQASVDDLGDLSTYYGYSELDAEGMVVWPGKVYPDTLENEQEVRQLDFSQLLARGYTDVVVKDTPEVPFIREIPVNLVSAEDYSNTLALGALPNLVLRRDGEVRYVIVNGYLLDVENLSTTSIENTLVIN